ncbi:MAG: hypothetical protein L0212_07265 [Acidobacteria bacterium]|nr:hypothetical protein [Acidobacteriota bacterium]
MNATGQRLEPIDTVKFDENQRKIPPEDLLPYAGLHVAWNAEGTKILATGTSTEELDQALAAQGIHYSQAVYCYIDDL